MLEIKIIKAENGEVGISFVIQTAGIKQKYSDIVSVFSNTKDRIEQRLRLFRLALQIVRADPNEISLEKNGRENQLSFAWKDSRSSSLRGARVTVQSDMATLFSFANAKIKKIRKKINGLHYKDLIKKKIVKVATGVSAVALIAFATISLMPLINATDENGLCSSVDVDVVLVIDTTGSMDQGGEPSKCEWGIRNGMCIFLEEEGLTEGECLEKPEGGEILCRNPVYTPPVLSKIGSAKLGAKSFVDSLGINDQSALVSFNTLVSLNQSLSSVHSATQSAIDALIAQPGTETNIAGAIAAANAELTARGNPQAIKAAILLTDGKDTNAVDLTEAVAKGYKIFTIGLGDKNKIDEPALQSIASTTHAQYHYAATGSDLAGIYDLIAGEICQYGSISGCKYLDADADGDITDENPLAGLSDWQIRLFDGTATTTQQTDLDGCYTFAGLLAGVYTVSETLQEGWQQTYPSDPNPNAYTETITTNWENFANRDFANYFSCDDGLWCNGIETYNLETYECQSGIPPVCLIDEIDCTDDYCDEENDQCVNARNDANCLADGWVDSENTQWVSSGSCTEKEQKEQEYRNYYCDAVLDCQYDTKRVRWVDIGSPRDEEDGTSCSDGDPCTINDVCSEGVCSGTPMNCNDDIDCTEDSCVDGVCQHDTSACWCNEDADCDDDNPCTNNICNLEACEITYNTNECNDGNACTIDDTCSEGSCSGVQIDCDDDIECTIDSCVDGECQYDDSNCPIEPVCGDGILEGDEQCDDGNTEDGDGCSSICAIEDTPDDPNDPDDPDPEPTPPSGGGGAVMIFPSILDVGQTDVNEDSVTITWRTSFFATSQVIYSTEGEVHNFNPDNPPLYGYAHMTPEQDTNPKVTFHTVVIPGLSPEQTYYYRTISRASPAVFSNEFTFTTLASLEEDDASETDEPASAEDSADEASFVKATAPKELSLKEVEEKLNEISNKVATIGQEVAKISPEVNLSAFASVDSNTESLAYNDLDSEESDEEFLFADATTDEDSFADAATDEANNEINDEPDDSSKFLAGIGTFFSGLEGWRLALIFLLGIILALIILRLIRTRIDRKK